MAIEITVLISVVSVSAALYFGLSSKKRSDNADVSKQVAEQTSILTRLEFINEGIKGINCNISDMNNKIDKQNERLIRLEESDKAQWQKLDKLETK